MLEQLTAFTELEAVNTIIGTIGESPINSLEDLTDVDALNALSILRSVSRQEQSRGWLWNKTPNLSLTPNEDTHRIRWNDQLIFIKSNEGRNLVRYGEYIKDLSEDTITFDKPLNVTAVIQVPFDSLPEAMRQYVLAKSCFVFQSRYLGDDQLAKILQTEVQLAWQYLQEYEMDISNASMLQSTDVQSILER